MHLLHHVPGLGCLKISPTCEHPKESGDGAETAQKNFYLEDTARLQRPGKDTALYLAAGAAQVERLRHRRDGLAAGLTAALERFPATLPVVVECSSAVPFLQPTAVILVIRPPVREMKPTTEAILSRVTDLLVNASDCAGAAVTVAEQLRRAYPALRPQFTWSTDLIVEPPPGAMLARLQARLSCATHNG
ncbi:MAG: hypothetical protein V2A79_13455 [Planctomycetota bacterium]